MKKKGKNGHLAQASLVASLVGSTNLGQYQEILVGHLAQANLVTQIWLGAQILRSDMLSNYIDKYENLDKYEHFGVQIQKF